MRFPGLSIPDTGKLADVISAIRNWSARWAVEAERLIGGLPVKGQVTLTTSAGTTTVSNPAMDAARNVTLTPLTANAAAEVAAGTLRISAMDKGSFTITHVNSATTGRDFRYSII